MELAGDKAEGTGDCSIAQDRSEKAGVGKSREKFLTEISNCAPGWLVAIQNKFVINPAK